ncbi:MAG: B12-binding domain-containing radical SAM protein [Micrococcales bacterium]|nr:B12-binding domain-containing radical SAM protein [Micrococcales bacterium]
MLTREMKRSLSLCLVNAPAPGLDDDHLEPPLGLLYLAACARDAGFEVEVADLTGTTGRQVPSGFDVYGWSTFSTSFHLSAELLDVVRRDQPSAFHIAGGPHATALPHQALSSGFDMVVQGEGERALVEALQAREVGQTLPEVVVGTPPMPLDDLPYPAFDLVDVDSYTRQVAGHRCLSVLTSRGCPFACSFCNSTIMGAGRPIRFRSPQAVVGELEFLRDQYDLGHFRFQDDNFAFSPRRVAEMTAALRPLDITYRCFSRVSVCSPEVAQALRASGCAHVSFGVESGSPAILGRHAMNKGQSPEQIAWALTNAHAAGLRTRIFLIVGFPGETDATIAETLALLTSVPWDEFVVYPLIPYPGTPIHDEPERFGITSINHTYSDYYQIGSGRAAGFVMKTDSFDEAHVRQWRDHVIDGLLAAGREWAGDSANYR